MSSSPSRPHVLRRIEGLLANLEFLLDRLDDSRAKVYLAVHGSKQPMHISRLVQATKLSRRQVYRALSFLKVIGVLDEIHGYWYERIAQ